MAVLYNEALRAPARRINDVDVPISAITIDHSSMTNASERRVINEWIDLGGQYYNTAFVAGAGDASSDGGTTYTQAELRTPPSGLNRSVFDATIQPILIARCAQCHQAFGGNGATGEANAEFSRNRFVLTGNPEGDFNITSTMVSDTSTAANNILLSKPTSTDVAVHPQINGGAQAVMSISDADYTTIANWITAP